NATLDATASNHALNVAGSWPNNGTFNAQNGTVTFSGATGTQTLNAGASALYNLTHSGAGTLKLGTNPLTVAGAFINSNGTFDANGMTNTVTGLATVSGGTYLARTAAQTFNGGLTIAGGTFTGAAGAVDVNGDLTISAGTLTAPAGTFTVSGNWEKIAGTFNPGTSTVVLDGEEQNISGDNTFYNLSKTASVQETLTFEAGSTQTILGTATFQGAAGNLLILESSTSGTSWMINAQNTSVSYVDVSDSENLNAMAINAVDSEDSGNNTNWMFTSSTQPEDTPEPEPEVITIVEQVINNLEQGFVPPPTGDQGGGQPQGGPDAGGDQGQGSGDAGGEGGGSDQAAPEGDQGNSGTEQGGDENPEGENGDQGGGPDNTAKDEEEEEMPTEEAPAEEEGPAEEEAPAEKEEQEEEAATEEESEEEAAQEEPGSEGQPNGAAATPGELHMDDYFSQPENFESSIDVIEGGQDAVYTIENSPGLETNYLSGGQQGTYDYTPPPLSDLPNFDRPEDMITTVDCEEGEVNVTHLGSDGLPTLDSVTGGSSMNFEWNS
ncbi:MAG: hypothetical protein WC352_02635, partial [Candidatus Omnitrophota bacterium]